MDEDWKSECLNGSSVQEFIINLVPGDSDCSCDEWCREEEDIGCEPLQ